jgi:hypothetical protein
MPLMTRLSSTRALPLVSVGRCGAIFANWASVSQKPSGIIGASLSEACESQRRSHANGFLGPSPKSRRIPIEGFLSAFGDTVSSALLFPG